MTTKANKIAVLGLDNVGKTSLIRKLKTGKAFENIPVTHGIEVTEYSINRNGNVIPVLFVDVGGLKVFQTTLWSDLISSDIKAVFYLVDVQSNTRNDNDRYAFNIVVNQTKVPILVIGNKYDTVEEKNIPINISHIFSILDIVEYKINDPYREIAVLPISVKNGVNLTMVVDWLYRILIKKKL